MKKSFLLIISVFISVFLFSANKAFATHASAGYITYQYISANTWKLELHFYRDCIGTSAPTSATVNVSSSCGGGPGTVNLTKVPGTGLPVEQSPCVPPVNTTCTGGSAYGIQEWVYTGNVTLPIACADWKFSYSLCCRNNAIGTISAPGSASLYIESILNTLEAPTNSSPVFSNIGISQFCSGSPVIWNQFATDADNDSLSYTLVCPQTAAGTSVNFIGGRSCASPIAAAPAVSLNAISGQMTFTPTTAQVAVLAVKVSEYRNGVLIGSIVRDMQVNIVNNCTIVPFDNAWLGFNVNWDDPINWCQGVPTLLTNAVVRSVGGPRYFSPIIKNGIVAQAKTLKISNNDSITIDASNSGSLTMADSLQNNATLIVTGSKYASEKFGYGTSAVAQFTPFKANYSDAKMQIIYTATELLANNLLGGDEIYELDFHINRRQSTQPYLNFTIKYYETNQNGYLVNVNAATTAGPFTVYNNAAESLAGIGLFAAGVHTITLDAPIIWNGTSNLLIEICYNSPLLIPGRGNLDAMTQTRTVGIFSVLLHELTGLGSSTLDGCDFDNSFAAGVVSTISEYRPNITFKFFRPYDEYPINIAGSWQNNGIFRQGNSKVTFNGNANQYILGTSTTTFDDVAVNKPAGRCSLLTAAFIDSTINLSNGAFSLNSNTLTLNYSSPLAINKTNGYFISENVPPAAYGKLKWNIGNNATAFVVPFGTAAGLNIPVTLTPLTGNFGLVEFSTFKTPVINTPYPTGIGSIPYLFPDMIDRYWNITRSTGTAITADLKLSYDEALEEAIPSTPNKHVVRWNSGVWDLTAPYVPYISIAGRREVTRSSTNSISPNWGIGNDPVPTPVELLTFDGESKNDYNYIWWVTATEINSDRFEIEKSLDLRNFELIATEKAQGNSNTDIKYAIKDYFPVNGIQYYRLKSIDLDGSFEYSKAIAIYNGSGTNFEVISLTPNVTNNLISVDFLYNSNKDLNIVVTDLVGKTIYKDVYNKAEGDNHHVDLNLKVSSALYFITFYNDEIKVTKKIAF